MSELREMTVWLSVGHYRSKTASYYRLTKPGIVYSNALTAVAGYLFASRWHAHIGVLVCLTVGTMCLIASACVYNNYIDRGIDRQMSRTRRRALVTGEISGRSALAYATLLGFIGLGALVRTNFLTVLIGIAAVLGYVVCYGFAKRHSVHGTLIGTLPGAASLLAGYTAVTGRLDVVALLLFLIMLSWQMSHFYAIAVRRHEEYAAAGLPVWPVRYGLESTARQMVGYCVLFIIAVSSLALLGHIGYAFMIVMGGLGVWWLWLVLQGVRTPRVQWARGVFFFSLVILLALTVMLPLGVILP